MATKRKREAVKPPTKEEWDNHKALLGELYFGLCLPKLMVKMETDHNFFASKNQYERKLRDEWGFRKNLTSEEWEYVLREKQRRDNKRKDTQVKLNGVTIRNEKIKKQQGRYSLSDLKRIYTSHQDAQPPDGICVFTPPPSPSGFSICANFRPRSPSPFCSRILQQIEVSPDLLGKKDDNYLLLSRLCRYVAETPSIVSGDDMQAVCDDLQAIINCKPRNPPSNIFENHAWTFYEEKNYDQWNLDSNRYIQEVLCTLQTDRNVKAIGRINVNPLLRWTYIPPTNRQQREHTTITSWLTPYGRISAIISSSPASSFLLDNEASISQDITSAKLVITPLTTTTPFCIEFEMKWQAYPNSCLNSINITYCAMRPDDSEVFLVARFGSVEELRQLLTNESARLTDRDTEGRSLLAYAIEDQNIEMIRFLVCNGADPNNPELDQIGYMGPVFGHRSRNEHESDEAYRKQRVEYSKILLEGGADYSLLGYQGAGEWVSSFKFIMRSCSVELLESVLNLGTPFISVNCWHDPELHSLLIFSHIFRVPDSTMFDMLEKAILLIKRGANIGMHDDNGDTALHILLKSYIRFYNLMGSSEGWGKLLNYHRLWFELQETLKVFITAGADIYTPNACGETPTTLASKSGLTEIWIKALEYCGIDSKAVIAYSLDSDPEYVRQYSKVTFEEYCQGRAAGLGRFEEIQDSDAGTDEVKGDNDESDEAESDEDIHTNKDRPAEEDVDQHIADELRTVSEMKGGENSSNYLEFYTQGYDSMGFDFMEQLAEG